MTTSSRKWLLFIVFYLVVLIVGLSLALPLHGVAPAAAVDEVGPDTDQYGYPCPMKGCGYDFYGAPCLYEDCHLSHLGDR